MNKFTTRFTTLVLSAIVSASAVIIPAHAANPYNISKLRIDELTIPTSTTQTNVLLTDKATFSKINLTIKPLALGRSDGKGFQFTDANGELIAFDISDDHQMQIYHERVVDSDDSVKIAANVEYDFVVYVKSTGIEVWFSTRTTIKKNWSISIPSNPRLNFIFSLNVPELLFVM